MQINTDIHTIGSPVAGSGGAYSGLLGKEGEYMREGKESRDSFRGQIGENVRQSRTEIEENILRLLYEWWAEGRTLNRDAVCGQLRMNRRKLAWYITSMTEHGYLESGSPGEDLVLTDFGKEQGADCRRRHRSITHFIQMTCGLDEKRAEENACRELTIFLW